jgi:hypothetical protein
VRVLRPRGDGQAHAVPAAAAPAGAAAPPSPRAQAAPGPRHAGAGDDRHVGRLRGRHRQLRHLARSRGAGLGGGRQRRAGLVERGGERRRAATDESGNWWDIDGGVLPAQVNADGVEDFLIRFQRSDGKRPLFVLAIDGATFARIWTSGPFGEDSDASTYSRVAASQKHVLVTDSSSRAHVVDLATGRQHGELRMSDRAERVCTEPGGEHAWIQVVDRKHLMVDLATGEATAETRPPTWCADPSGGKWQVSCTHYAGTVIGKGKSRARCLDVPSKWRIDGFGRSYALRTERGYVAVGSKDPGTAFPILVGLDPRGKVKWRRGVSDDEGEAVEKETPKLVDVVGGAIVVAYKLQADRWRLAALDEGTGATRWQRDLAEETRWAAGMTVSDQRVYVLLSSTLAVHDLATGKELAVLKSR